MLLSFVLRLIFMANYVRAITIQTPLGTILGMERNTSNNETIYEFLNIPYAKPPVGNLRFKKPEAYGLWNGVLNATSHGPSCIQNMSFVLPGYPPSTDTDEDCLSLNIYVPYNFTSTSNRSVMVWIHGGAFQVGQAKAFDPTNLAIVGNVILVTINYRLGVFGFYYSGDSYGVGNYGLWDQKLALEWINQNIEWFGGNPNSVTIFGESAGGMSAALLSLNPQCHGLFQRVIAQSGDSTFDFAVGIPFVFKEIYKNYSESVGCAVDPDNASYVFACLQALPANTLSSAQYNLTLVGPIMDGDFILNYPELLLQNTSSEAYLLFKSLDFISGVTDADGSVVLSYLEPVPFSVEDGVPSKYFCDVVVPFSINLSPSYSDIEGTTDAVCKMYEDTSSLSNQGKRAVDMLTDFFFLIPSIQSLNVHSFDNSIGSTYQYLLVYTNAVAKAAIPRYDWLTTAVHADDTIFLFGMEEAAKMAGIQLSHSDLLLIQQLAEYWTNFAKTGNPNGDGLPLWSEYNRSERKYLSIESSIVQRSNVKADRVKFWMEDVYGLTSNTPSSSSRHYLDIWISVSLLIYWSILEINYDY